MVLYLFVVSIPHKKGLVAMKEEDNDEQDSQTELMQEQMLQDITPQVEACQASCGDELAVCISKHEEAWLQARR
jgi:hypothetical protein